MINSRKISDLHPVLQTICKKHILACHNKGFDLLITNTLRDAEYQAYLYSFGRTVTKKSDGTKQGIVTMMKDIGPHAFGLAYDVVPCVTVEGKKIAVYSQGNLPKGWKGLTCAQMWAIVGLEGKKLGLEWANDWKSFPEKCHFQKVEGLTSAQLRAGKRPSFWAKK